MNTDKVIAELAEFYKEDPPAFELINADHYKRGAEYVGTLAMIAEEQSEDHCTAGEFDLGSLLAKILVNLSDHELTTLGREIS